LVRRTNPILTNIRRGRSPLTSVRGPSFHQTSRMEVQVRVHNHRKRRVPPPPNVHKEVLARQRKELLEYPGKVRRNRSDEEWHELYEQSLGRCFLDTRRWRPLYLVYTLGHWCNTPRTKYLLRYLLGRIMFKCKEED
jgi:hypothetical protein